jgi:hypothetical protein
MQSMPPRDEIVFAPPTTESQPRFINMETLLPILPNLYWVLFALGAQSDIFRSVSIIDGNLCSATTARILSGFSSQLPAIRIE